jgi:hypothetical protein
MFDRWVAECLPCKWETLHKSQDEAISAAEDHVHANHRKVAGAVRGQRKMGHVTQRTILEAHDIQETPPAEVPVTTAALPDSTSGQSAESGSEVDQIQRATDEFLASLRAGDDTSQHEG